MYLEMKHRKNKSHSGFQDQTIPHLLFSGNAGIGKTTLAKLLFAELDILPI